MSEIHVTYNHLPQQPMTIIAFAYRVVDGRLFGTVLPFTLLDDEKHGEAAMRTAVKREAERRLTPDVDAAAAEKYRLHSPHETVEISADSFAWVQEAFE